MRKYFLVLIIFLFCSLQVQAIGAQDLKYGCNFNQLFMISTTSGYGLRVQIIPLKRDCVVKDGKIYLLEREFNLYGKGERVGKTLIGDNWFRNIRQINYKVVQE